MGSESLLHAPLMIRSVNRTNEKFYCFIKFPARQPAAAVPLSLMRKLPRRAIRSPHKVALCDTEYTRAVAAAENDHFSIPTFGVHFATNINAKHVGNSSTQLTGELKMSVIA